MNVTILGPNLSSKHQRIAQLHVHKTGCADIVRGFTRDERVHLSEHEVGKRADVAEYFFGHTAGGFFEEGGGLDRYASYESFLDDMTGEFHWAPCVKELK